MSIDASIIVVGVGSKILIDTREPQINEFDKLALLSMTMAQVLLSIGGAKDVT